MRQEDKTYASSQQGLSSPALSAQIKSLVHVAFVWGPRGTSAADEEVSRQRPHHDSLSSCRRKSMMAVRGCASDEERHDWMNEVGVQAGKEAEQRCMKISAAVVIPRA